MRTRGDLVPFALALDLLVESGLPRKLPFSVLRASGLFLRRHRAQIQKAASAAMTTAPTATPTAAPIGIELPLLSPVGAVGKAEAEVVAVAGSTAALGEVIAVAVGAVVM